MISPNECDRDGIDHINVYSKGRTDLGRWLSNFAYSPIDTKDGFFCSIEGYWYWLTRRDDRLRKVVGFNAKKLGKSLPKITEVDDFKERICEAINIKISSSKRMGRQFFNSTLPFKHYYVFGDKCVDAGYKWILEHLEDLRGKNVESNN